MNKSRRDQFENQLRDLQNDISNLSEKLSVPSMVSANRYVSAVNINDVYEKEKDTQSFLHQKNSADVSRQTYSHPHQPHSDAVEKLRQEIYTAKSERDDAVYRLQQAKMELEDLRKKLLESARIQASFVHLKQDYESLRVSLESSERIRKQQKELINLLQRSQSMAAVPSDANSVISFNSGISTIPPPPHMSQSGLETSSSVFNAAAPINAPDLSSTQSQVSSQYEHQQWLNSYESSNAESYNGGHLQQQQQEFPPRAPSVASGNGSRSKMKLTKKAVSTPTLRHTASSSSSNSSSSSSDHSSARRSSGATGRSTTNAAGKSISSVRSGHSHSHRSSVGESRGGHSASAVSSLGNSSKSRPRSSSSAAAAAAAAAATTKSTATTRTRLRSAAGESGTTASRKNSQNLVTHKSDKSRSSSSMTRHERGAAGIGGFEVTDAAHRTFREGGYSQSAATAGKPGGSIIVDPGAAGGAHAGAHAGTYNSIISSNPSLLPSAALHNTASNLTYTSGHQQPMAVGVSRDGQLRSADIPIRNPLEFSSSGTSQQQQQQYYYTSQGTTINPSDPHSYNHHNHNQQHNQHVNNDSLYSTSSTSFIKSNYSVFGEPTNEHLAEPVVAPHLNTGSSNGQQPVGRPPRHPTSAKRTGSNSSSSSSSKKIIRKSSSTTAELAQQQRRHHQQQQHERLVRSQSAPPAGGKYIYRAVPSPASSFGTAPRYT